MEVAAYLADKAASVTVIGRSSIPFAKVLGKKVGSLLKKVWTFEDNMSIEIEFFQECDRAKTFNIQKPAISLLTSFYFRIFSFSSSVIPPSQCTVVSKFTLIFPVYHHYVRPAGLNSWLF